MNRSLVVDASVALKWVVSEHGSYVSGSGRWFRCLHTALDWSITTYDALYVLLAIDFDAELVTADERLVAAIPAGPVRLLVAESDVRAKR